MLKNTILNFQSVIFKTICYTSINFISVLTLLVSTTPLVSSQGVDQTTQAEANGKDVVEATLARFDSLHTPHRLANFNEFLRRVAYVETRFGMNEDTFRDGYHGGIWQVSIHAFICSRNPFFLAPPFPYGKGFVCLFQLFVCLFLFFVFRIHWNFVSKQFPMFQQPDLVKVSRLLWITLTFQTRWFVVE